MVGVEERVTRWKGVGDISQKISGNFLILQILIVTDTLVATLFADLNTLFVT